MKTTLPHYDCRAEKSWQAFCPRRVAEWEATGRLQTLLQAAEDQTERERYLLRRHFRQQGLTP